MAYLAGIRLTHLERGHSDPINNEPLHLLIWGICRLQGDSPRYRLPITIKVPCILKHQLCTGNFPFIVQHLLWTAFTLAFYGFICISEFTGTSLQCSDLQLNARHLSITISQSKADPFCRGHVFHPLPTGTSTCPVKVFNQYAAMILHSHRVDPLFSSGKFSPLLRTQLCSTLRSPLQRAGYNPQHYYTQSFRIGVVTTSAAAGLPPWLIKTMGRWNSDAYLTYIQVPTSLIKTVPSSLAQTDIPDNTSPGIH